MEATLSNCTKSSIQKLQKHSMGIFLFSDGKELPMERRHEVFGNGTLSIRKVTKKDAGSYGCTATNRQGSSATQTGHLKVIGEFSLMLNRCYLLLKR